MNFMPLSYIQALVMYWNLSHNPRFRERYVLKNNVTNVHTFVFATEAALAVVSLGWVTRLEVADLVNTLFHLV
jgi:hypothetical protein